MNKKIANFSFYPKKLKPILLTIIIISALAIISVPLFKNLSQRYILNQEIKNLKKQINNLESKNTAISKMIQYFETDSYVEEQSRLNLNLKKAGEDIVVIKNQNSSSTPNNTGADILLGQTGLSQNETEISNFAKWQRYFFN